jgi:hypothetical protein
MTKLPHGIWKIPMSRDGILKIEIDPKDIKACAAAAVMLYAMMREHHGTAAANEIMNRPLLTKRDAADLKNYELLKAADGDRSVEEVATELAERNKSLPRELRYGPTGSTSPSTLAKQIRRLRKNTAD